ncbi:DUF5316 domain-containing protein [Halobacillus mangrovi]|uniref:DUF5316 domain-containing protein n=1 Tax=Halobacillus mangrovi TaxID=402384 RepID=A0A1W5ZX10_9BACI|nr:DUF5316 domain-containing protein [Halobacillus mangrovi]ARI77845.1 hypothetical protein HM131_13735 [Halobacillus mangrovi]
MKVKCLGIGLLGTLSSVAYGLYSNEWGLPLKIIGISAVVPLLLTGVLTGAFVDGDRNRANYHSEVKEDRDNKSRWLIGLLLVSGPNAIFMIVLIIIGLTRI